MSYAKPWDDTRHEAASFSPRVDNDARKKKDQIARQIIYERNYAVNSEAVENLLKEEILVATTVSL